MIRVLLVSDHTSVRQALSIVFEREPDCTVVAQAGSLEETRDVLDRYDVAVVDLDLHNGDGVLLIRELHEANAGGTILALTSSTDRKRYGLAVETGASGVLHSTNRCDSARSSARSTGAADPA